MTWPSWTMHFVFLYTPTTPLFFLLSSLYLSQPSCFCSKNPNILKTDRPTNWPTWLGIDASCWSIKMVDHWILILVWRSHCQKSFECRPSFCCLDDIFGLGNCAGTGNSLYTLPPIHYNLIPIPYPLSLSPHLLRNALLLTDYDS